MKPVSVLSEAIHRLLGLDIVERLQDDLRVYIQRRTKEFATEEIKSEISELQVEYARSKSVIETSLEEQHCEDLKLAALVAEKDRLQIELSERGGDWAVSRRLQQERAHGLSEEIEMKERQLKDELAGCYPLSLIPEILTEVLSTASSGLIAFSRIEANELLANFAGKLSTALDDEGKAVVDRALRDSRIEVNESESRMDISHQGLARIEHTVHRTIPEAIDRIRDLSKRIVELKNDLEITNSKIDRAPDRAVLSNTLENLNNVDRDAQDVGAAIAVRQQELRRSYAKSIVLARSLRDKFKLISEFEKAEQPLRYATAIRRLLREFHRINSCQKIEQLEFEFTDTFRRLARKDDIVDHVRIDPLKFTVTLINRDGREIKKSQLSAGEKADIRHCYA